MKTPSFIILITILSIPLSAKDYPGLNFGIQTGWSLGLSESYKWYKTPHVRGRDQLGYHGGAYIQVNLSQQIGIQADLNIQSNYEEIDWETGYEKNGRHIVLLSFKLAMSSNRSSSSSWYLLLGGGPCIGSISDLDGFYYNLTAEPGVKLYLFKSNPNVGIKIGAAFFSLLDYDRGHLWSTSYIRLNLGIEF